MNQFIQNSWSRVPQKRTCDPLDSVREDWLYRRQESDVDDISWRDLDMDPLFFQLNSTFSTVGSEYLYRRLHNTDIPNFDHWERLIQAITEDEPLRLKLARILYRMGKNDYHGLHSWFDKKHSTSSPWIFKMLQYSLLLWPVLFFVDRQAALLGLVVNVALNFLIHYHHEATFRASMHCVNHLALTLSGARKVMRIKHPALEQKQHTLREALRSNRQLLRSVGALSKLNEANELAGVLTILQAATLSFVNQYYKLSRLLQQNPDIYEKLSDILGEMDAAWSVASYRSRTNYCLPQFTEYKAVLAEDLAHPLLAEPVTNPVVFDQNTLISGSNASGKSTYVRSIALACIMAQSLNTVLATSFQMPRAKILSSMAITDDVLAGESYFIAEIKSIKRILDTLSEEKLTLAFIDEILRGTNTVERIAASHALLEWFKDQPLLFMVATHDRELMRLQSQCKALHFREQITEEGIHFDYQLQQGPSTTKNAIRLLEHLHYPPAIIQLADEKALQFEQTGSWE